MQVIDVYILTGFLGSGKTTALNALLSGQLADANPALIINEFGSHGVDGVLVKRRDLTRYEINKGSIFCICTKTDFLKALAEIAEGRRHSTLLIEATGIAETADIESFIEAEHLGDRFQVRANICLVDAANFTRVAAFLRPAVTQVCRADAIVVNKTDLVSESERRQLKTVLRELNPQAAMLETEFGKLPAEFLDGVRHTKYDQSAFEQPPAEITAVSISSSKVFDRAAFFASLSRFKENLLRLKGHILFPEGLRFVELAGTVLSETAPAQGYEGATRFTAIAFKTDRKTLADSLSACEVSA
jgi:G3E family GTPase